MSRILCQMDSNQQNRTGGKIGHTRENNYFLQTFGLGNTDSEYKDPHPIIDMRSIYKFVTVQSRFGVS